jgi:DNA-binding SARP family transcriptional activator
MTALRLLGRLLRGLAALVLLVGFLVGVPVGLWVFIGWPLPHALPTWNQLSRALTDPIPDQVLLNTLAVVCWLLWAGLAVSVAVEVVAAVRGRAARRLPVLGPMQGLAGWLVAAVLFAVVPANGRATAGTATPSLPAVPAPPVGIERPAVAPTLPDDAEHATARPAPAPQARQRQYVVRRRDTLWGIAERELGDPFRWPELFRLNNNTPQPDGGILTDPDLIRPGWVLKLPPRPGGPAAVPPAQPRGTRGAPERQPAPTPATTAREPETRVCPPAVRLPSGSMVGLSVAVAVAAALAVARRRRRHGRLPGEPRPGIRRHDPAADETLRWLERVALGGAGYGDPDADREEPEEPTRPAAPTQRVLRLLDQADASPEAPAMPQPNDAPPPGAAAALPGEPPAGQGEPPWPAPVPVALGHRDGEEIALELSGAGGLTLTGAGAADVARALLVAFLSRHTPEVGEVVVASDRLLSGIAPFPGLRRHDGLAAALTELEVEVVRRGRLLQEAEAADFASYRLADPAEPMPALLLATDTVPAALAGRPRALARFGRRLGIGILVVDEAGVHDTEPWGARLMVDADGTLIDASPDQAAGRLAGTRLFCLTAEDAAVTLAVLADARHEPDLQPTPEPGAPMSAAPAEPAEPDPRVAANSRRLLRRADGGASPVTDGEGAAAPLPSAALDAAAEPEERFEVAPPAAQPLVGVQVLGPYRIQVADQEVRGRLRTTGRELFAYYLLHPGGATLEGAVDALWPDTQPGRESGRFWNALNSLRARLRSATGQPDLKVLERTNERYRIDPDLVDVDLWHFQRALADARDATSTADKLAALERAAAAYGGDLLAHTDYTWAEPARVDLRGRAVDTLAQLAELRDQAGDRHGALTTLERAITVDPDCEELYRRLMRLQADLGDPDAVRRTYRRLRAHLLNELDVEPDPTSQELFERLLAKHRRRHPSGLPEQP